MGKKKLLLIPVIVIAAIAAFMWFTLNPSVAAAQLVIDSGTVEVMHAGGDWTPASSGMLLSQSDSVRTGENSAASIILFESSIIRLDSSTLVTLQELLQAGGETSVGIKQDLGRTWNTVLKISGIDDYEVQTPTTVASIRGTSFDIRVEEDGETDVGVGRGKLKVTIYVIEDGVTQVKHEIELDKDELVNVDPDIIDRLPEKTTFVLDDWARGNMQKDEEFLEKVKQDFYRRVGPFIPLVKQQYGVTDEQLDELIDGYLRGEYELPPETPDWARDIIELS
jgi:hypothetical protein